MPPHSKELFQEGAAIQSEKLVSEGQFNEKRITELLYEEPAQYPECSGTRCLADNLNDLKAQIAANQKGINLISALIGDYGEDVVQFYMRKIQENAELSVRNLLKEVSAKFANRDLSAIDYMDDGSPIQLRISINAEKGEAVFDFEGTGPEVYGEKIFGITFLLRGLTCPREHQCSRSCYLLCNHLLSKMSNIGRYPAEPRMSKTNRRPHTKKFFPLAFSQSRRSRWKCSNSK